MSSPDPEERRDEAYYQRALARHPHAVDANPVRMFRQLHVGEAIADLVVLGDRATACEIKTDLDDFARLDRQVANYCKAFPYVTLVVPERRVASAAAHLAGLGEPGRHAGIIALDADGVPHPVRPAVEYVGALENDTLIRLLRKPEYLDMLARLGFAVPNPRRADCYRRCRELFAGVPVRLAVREVMEQLRRR